MNDLGDMVSSLSRLMSVGYDDGDASVLPPVEFAPVVSRPCNGGAQYVYAFPNGWAASVVKGPATYGGDAGLWEIAVGTYDAEEHFHLNYSTPITDDVLGWQSDEDLASVLVAVAALPAAS